MLRSLLNNLLIQGEILSYLQPNDRINLWHAFQDDSLEFNYPIQISDRDHQISILPRINKLAIIASVSIKSTGSMFTIKDAINGRNLPLINFLIEHGFNLNYKKDGYTPIMTAVINKSYCITKLLLKKGANPNYGEDSYGKPIVIAAYEKCSLIFKLLLKYGAQLSNDDIVQIFVHNNQSIIDILLTDSSLNLDICGKHCYGTPLTRAVTNENYPVILALLKKGVSIDAIGDFGHTALALAVIRDRKDIVELLLEFGASIHATNPATKVTILEEALKRGNPKILKLLQK